MAEESVDEMYLKITKQLKAIQDSFQFIKQSGLDEDIMKAYIRDKTGTSKRDIEEILEAQDDFFKRLSRLAVRPKKEGE